MPNNFNITRALFLYDEGIKNPNFKKIISFIKKNFGSLAVKVVRLKERVVSTKGLIFDPIRTKDAFEEIAYKDKKACPVRNSISNGACHIILTEKIFATYDEDKKLHIRASIYGFPSVISISGIVEGPAKPKDYYIYKEKFTRLGTWALEEPKIKKKFKGRFIDYGDKRIPEVLKGYISQALFFYMTGEPFCDQKKCRLFNSHWQEDLIYSQIRIGEFCPSHKKFLKSL